jgi:hypothetical protein
VGRLFEHYNQPIGDLHHMIWKRFNGVKSALVEGPANLLVTVYTGCTVTLISGGGGGFGWGRGNWT